MQTIKYSAMICCYALFAAINAEESFAQGLIINGGFESPAISPGSTQDVDPEGWVRISSESAITHLFNGNGGVAGVPMPHGGNQQFLLGFQRTGISQNVTIGESNPFRLNWWTATDISSSDVPMTYNIRIWNSSDSSLVAANQFEAQLGTAWVNTSMEIYLQSGSYLVEFRTTDFFNGGGIFLDDVSMNPVPEPNTSALFGFGALAFVAMQSVLSKPRVDD